MALLRQALLGCMLLAVAFGHGGEEHKKTVGDILDNNGLTVLKAALTALNFTDALEDPDIKGTLFAPTDAAFGALLANLNMTAGQLLASTSVLQQVVTYHFNSLQTLRTSSFRKGQSIKTNLPGHDLKVISRTRVAGEASQAKITKKDLFASGRQAVVHIVDTVLLPDVDLFPKLSSVPNPAVLESNQTGGFGGAGDPCKVCFNVLKPMSQDALQYTFPVAPTNQPLSTIQMFNIYNSYFYQTVATPAGFTVCIETDMVNANRIMGMFGGAFGQSSAASAMFAAFPNWNCIPGNPNLRDQIQSTAGSLLPTITPQQCGSASGTIYWRNGC